MKAKELRDLDKSELQNKEKSLKKELFNLNFQKQFGQVEKPGRFRNIKRNIARIQTILKEREQDGTAKKLS